MKNVLMTETEWKETMKQRYKKACKDTITGGLEAFAKYTAFFLIFGGLPVWMLLDWLSKGCQEDAIMRINIHINENGNGYTVTASQESFSDMRIRKGELNKAIYRMIDKLEASERKQLKYIAESEE